VAITDTLTTREALRRAALDDIIARCELASVVMEGGELDGLKVVSMGVLRDQVSGALMVKLPPPPNTWAEVATPATIVTSVICPECDLPQVITVKLGPKLTVDDDGAELSVKANSKGSVHVHGQLSLDGEAEQIGMDDVVIDDHRLRILRAVAAVGDRYTDAGDVQGPDSEPLPPMPTLDAIARELELATEADRFDLQDSLQGYAQADPPLVAIDTVAGEVTTYALTDAGSELIDAGETPSFMRDDDSGDADEAEDAPSDPA
jgi:hypothetical protein